MLRSCKRFLEVTLGNCYVFHIELVELTPIIWRRLEIRREKTFWDLHCAIQDAMPWDDMHLHEFQFPSGDQETRIGFPDLDYGDLEILASHETPLRDWFIAAPSRCSYLYDFGDSWRHLITLEAIRPTKKGERYPRCLAGERRCPPESVGGVLGYEHFLEALADPDHPDHDRYQQWIGHPWDAEHFQPDEVKFSRPSERLRHVGLR